MCVLWAFCNRGEVGVLRGYDLYGELQDTGFRIGLRRLPEAIEQLRTSALAELDSIIEHGLDLAWSQSGMVMYFWLFGHLNLPGNSLCIALLTESYHSIG